MSDETLVAEIKQSGSKATCTFCGRRSAKTWSIQALADRIEPVFHEHFVLSPSAPEGYELFLHMDKESTYEWTRDGEPANEVIQSMAGITEEIADAVIAELGSRQHRNHHDDPGEEDPFGYEACYMRTVTDGNRLQRWWESIKEDVTFMQMSDEADDVEYVVHLSSVPGTAPTTDNDSSIDEPLLEQGFAGWVPHGSASAELAETPPTLELVATELEVVEIRAVKFETRRHQVSHWQRDPARDLDPKF